jgi:hypothetical protein
MRCPDCNKFVGMDTDNEPEMDESGFDEEEGKGTITVRIANACAECSQELKEANFELEFDLSDDFEEAKRDDPDAELEWSFDCTRQERTEGKGRGLRTFYGVEVTVSLNNVKGAITTESQSDESQASGMDELV